MKLIWRNFSLDFSEKTHIMGILNVTPDSFSDGGLFSGKSSAINRAIQMVVEGADIIDIGGESTRPGSEPVTIEEEIERTIPVIETIVKEIHIPISIDTCKSEVARRALDAGASMVNDISGLRFDPKMPQVVAEYKVPVVVMHIKGTPGDMQKNPVYEALIPEILDYLRESIRTALESGIPEDRIIIDPGIGFGKTYEHNLELIRNLKEFKTLGYPILIGLSRKSFINNIYESLPSERLEGTLVSNAVSVINGANILRVHDVLENKRAAITACKYK